MAASPQFKVYNSAGVYLAACKEPEAAAALASLYGDGSTIRMGHKITLWTEGTDGQSASLGFDVMAQLISDRLFKIYADRKNQLDAYGNESRLYSIEGV